MYKPINSWTKANILKHIEKHFTFKSELGPNCLYRGEVNRTETKCAVGLFIPNELYNKNMEGYSANTLLVNHPELCDLMPLERDALTALQMRHDNSDPLETKQILLDWVEVNVEEV